MKTMMVVIGGRKLETTIENGVQRLPYNPLYKYLIDSKQIDLNQMAVDYQRGKISFDDYLDFYLNIGYSVSGFSSLSAFQHLAIVNPLWKGKNA